ncbi:MAG: hypothetical protein Q8M07_29700 [Prosthecobacter sp.]|nr:hypothetical protein [Prosthecobacter sp.]
MEPPAHRLCLLPLFLLGLLPGCSGSGEKLDTAWRSFDPAGHSRMHREKYYPNERKTGLRLPGDSGR